LVKKKKKEYESIEILKGPESIRNNLGMYAGSKDHALNHMILECLDNSIDENMAGHCNKIIIHFLKDGSVLVQDNGRGIPVKHMKEEGKSSLEAVFTDHHSGGKFNSDNYQYSGGLHGIGLCLVNALSEWLKVIIYRDGHEHLLNFKNGYVSKKLLKKKLKKNRTGTLIHFMPDKAFFKGYKILVDKIHNKAKEISYLCNNLDIVVVDDKVDKKTLYNGKKNNIGNYVEHIATDLLKTNLLDKPITIKGKKDGVEIDIGLQWSDDFTEEFRCYTNNIPNPDGGTHLAGFRSGLTRTFTWFLKTFEVKQKIKLTSDDIREGLVYVINVRHPRPSFSSQTKEKLVSEDVRSIIESITTDKFKDYCENNSAEIKKIIKKATSAAKARDAARKAKELERKKGDFGVGGLVGKLADCQEKDPRKCEIFIVEGDSAGGSAKQGRDRKTQAILPLRGKVLNVEKNDFKKMLENKELVTLVTALGVGIGPTLKPDRLRYGRVIIFTDSDVDGSHIRTLLLTFFYRQMPQLMFNGNIYIAQPPLYRIVYKGKTVYLKDDREKESFEQQLLAKYNIRKLKRRTKKALYKATVAGKDIDLKDEDAKKEFIFQKLKGMKLQRFKGLGEMNPDQLWETAMNPNTRNLLKVEINNIAEADKMFSILMSSDTDARRNFIIGHSSIVKNLDI